MVLEVCYAKGDCLALRVRTEFLEQQNTTPKMDSAYWPSACCISECMRLRKRNRGRNVCGYTVFARFETTGSPVTEVRRAPKVPQFLDLLCPGSIGLGSRPFRILFTAGQKHRRDSIKPQYPMFIGPVQSREDCGLAPFSDDAVDARGERHAG